MFIVMISEYSELWLPVLQFCWVCHLSCHVLQFVVSCGPWQYSYLFSFPSPDVTFIDAFLSGKGTSPASTKSWSSRVIRKSKSSVPMVYKKTSLLLTIYAKIFTPSGWTKKYGWLQRRFPLFLLFNFFAHLILYSEL